MITEVIMPKLGLTMNEGQIVKWRKSEGDLVTKGDILFDVETDKLITEVEARGEGILQKIMVMEGETVQIGSVIAIITDQNEKIPESYLKNKTVFSEENKNEKEKEVFYAKEQKAQEETTLGNINASPAVRHLAKEHGVDLESIKGTGPGGRITEEDLRKYINKNLGSEKKEVNSKFIPVEGIRKTIANRMSKSSQNTASVTLMAEADFTKIRDIRESLRLQIKKEKGINISYTDFIIWAVSRALSKYPKINASFLDNKIEIKGDKNIGLAVDIPAGLIVPVIKEADKKNLNEIVTARFELVEKALKDSLTLSDVSGGTFTISNLGMFGIDYFTPIINLPETAILGVGRIKERVFSENGKVVIKPTVYLSLTFDHRVIDGAPASRFLQAIVDLLQEPEGMN